MPAIHCEGVAAVSAQYMRLEGKDWFREDEAAEYCGVALSTFREECRARGIRPKRFGGRKLYSRASLYHAIDSSEEWQPSTRAANPGTSAGPKMASSSGAALDRLRPARLREYAPRKRQS